MAIQWEFCEFRLLTYIDESGVRSEEELDNEAVSFDLLYCGPSDKTWEKYEEFSRELANWLDEAQLSARHTGKLLRKGLSYLGLEGWELMSTHISTYKKRFKYIPRNVFEENARVRRGEKPPENINLIESVSYVFMRRYYPDREEE